MGPVESLTRARCGRTSVGGVVLVLTLGGQLDQQLTELTDNVTWLVHT